MAKKKNIHPGRLLLGGRWREVVFFDSRLWTAEIYYSMCVAHSAEPLSGPIALSGSSIFRGYPHPSAIFSFGHLLRAAIFFLFIYFYQSNGHDRLKSFSEAYSRFRPSEYFFGDDLKKIYILRCERRWKSGTTSMQNASLRKCQGQPSRCPESGGISRPANTN